jgi:hypothetical protein
MFYRVDEDARQRRFFSKEVLYSSINWSDLASIVDAFHVRIADWYLQPARHLAANLHFSFSVMALNCLLIDALSQFVYGEARSSGSVFKKFVRSRLPAAYSTTLQTPIRHLTENRERSLVDIADVLYHGFRCGILHQAHNPPYGLVIPHAEEAVHVAPAGLVRYADSSDCPAVVVDPLALLEALDKAFAAYLAELKSQDPANDPLRANFKKTFTTTFGVDVTTAA